MGGNRRRGSERTRIVFVSFGYDFGLRGKSEWEVEDADLMSLFERKLPVFRRTDNTLLQRRRYLPVRIARRRALG